MGKKDFHKNWQKKNRNQQWEDHSEEEEQQIKKWAHIFGEVADGKRMSLKAILFIFSCIIGYVFLIHFFGKNHQYKEQ